MFSNCVLATTHRRRSGGGRGAPPIGSATGGGEMCVVPSVFPGIAWKHIKINPHEINFTMALSTDQK